MNNGIILACGACVAVSTGLLGCTSQSNGDGSSDGGAIGSGETGGNVSSNGGGSNGGGSNGGGSGGTSNGGTGATGGANGGGNDGGAGASAGGGGTSSNGGASGSGGTASGGSNGSGGTANGGSNGSGGVPSGPPITPGDPGAHDVLFTIDTTSNVHAISPYVYGTNQGDLKAEAKNLTLTRVGGNRMTAYNWETNASNAGSDYQYENDNYISSSSTAGDPMKQAVTAATSAGASIIMTVPMAGWVSADESGPDDAHPSSDSVIEQHFFPIIASKGSAFSYPPATTDGKVYADEFVAWLESQFPTAQTDPTKRIFYMLDNEPDLWSSTHSEIHPNAVTYAELVQKSTQFAAAIKKVAPKTLVFGPASYGWEGYVSLQNAPDANGRDFIEFYLDSMKTAEQQNGARLVDVLDLHWYPEATGGGTRITDEGTGAAEVAARLQAPRSLWDDTYTETSWITSSTNGPIELIPRMMKKIADHYPGTLLSISEYNYGGGGDVSGGIAEADVLGIFGRDGMFAATAWLLGSTNTFLFGGFAMYRNYDGNGASFGDTSVSATTSATDESSVYASISSTNGTNVVVVAINKQSSAVKAGITLKHPAMLTAADVYTMSSASATPTKGAALTPVATNAFDYSMPPMSVTTLVFHP
jgi:hypothetical protein